MSDRLALMRRSEAAEAPTYMLLAHERQWVLRLIEAADELAKRVEVEVLTNLHVRDALAKYATVRGTQEAEDR